MMSERWLYGSNVATLETPTDLLWSIGPGSISPVMCRYALYVIAQKLSITVYLIHITSSYRTAKLLTLLDNANDTVRPAGE